MERARKIYILRRLKMIYNDKQPPLKSKMADIIGDLLDGENLNRALDFITYLKNNKISIQWTSTNTWKATKKGVVVCYIKAGIERETGNDCYVRLADTNDSEKGSWVILPHISGIGNYPHDTNIGINIGYEEIVSNEKIFNIICSKVRPCSNCGNSKKCAPGININFWGKEINNRCKFFAIPFLDPDPDELDCVKLLINIFYETSNL
jgi:hypothetical protein